MLRMKDDEWYDVINTNLNSLYRLSKAVLRGMTKARWGGSSISVRWLVPWVTPGR